MTPHRTLPGAPLALGLVLLYGAGPARAAGEAPPTPSRSLSARGPLALSLAAEPRATHWTIETAWPLGTRDAAGVRRPGAFRLEGMLLATRDLSNRDERPGGLATSLLLDHASRGAASWFGLSLGGPSGGSLPLARVRAGAGMARVLTAVQAEASVISSLVLFRNDSRWTTTRHWRLPSGPDTLAGWRDTSATVPADHSALWTTVQGSVRWQRSRWAVESVGGLSLGEGAGPRRWAQGTVRLQLARRLLALASIGERPAPSLAFDGAAHPHTMIGLQLAPWSTPEWAMTHALYARAIAWRTQPAGEGRTLVRVHAPGASRVEVAGDFSDWESLPLLGVHGGWWSAVVPAAPGVHRVQLRLDGGPWQAPPGLPRADDGPGGPAGTLVVRGRRP